jgi:hypothetical protein
MRDMKENMPYANYNGPGKPITTKQLLQILAKVGVYPDKEGMLHWKDIDEAVERNVLTYEINL